MVSDEFEHVAAQGHFVVRWIRDDEVKGGSACDKCPQRRECVRCLDLGLASKAE
jgi:hypothetical protein